METNKKQQLKEKAMEEERRMKEFVKNSYDKITENEDFRRYANLFLEELVKEIARQTVKKGFDMIPTSKTSYQQIKNDFRDYKEEKTEHLRDFKNRFSDRLPNKQDLFLNLLEGSIHAIRKMKSKHQDYD